MARRHAGGTRHPRGERPERGERRRRVAGLGAGVAMATVLAAAVALGGDQLVPAPTSGPAGPGTAAPTTLDDAAPAALSTFDSCPALLAYYRATALPLVGPYGLGGGISFRRGVALGGASEGSGEPAGSAAAAAPTQPMPQDASSRSAAAPDATRSDSGTTVQVAGVDEVDLAKRVGDLLLVLVQSPDDGTTTVQVMGTQGAGTDDARAVRVGRFVPGWIPTSMLVDGTRVLLIGSEAGVVRGEHTIEAFRERTRIDELDLSDPAQPRRLRTLTLDGSPAGARMVDGVVRLAVTSAPRLAFDTVAIPPDTPVSSGALGPANSPWEQQAPGEQQAPWEQQATARQQQVVRRSTIDDWLPQYDLTEANGTQSSGRLVGCADVAAPPDPAGVSTLTMVTVDLRASGLAQWATDAVVATGSTLYATAERTYVATPALPLAAESGRPSGSGRATTAVHVFDTAGRDGGRYLASGRVSGTLLNQFSMDEYEGALRVASTDGPTFWGMPVDVAQMPAEGAGPPAGDVPALRATSAPDAPSVPQSRVTVLRRDGSRLVRSGMVDGMGRGERIYAVRFAGPVGYVVTFRQTDPLYTLDLTEPSRPRVVGELKIRGYSAYLQPAGEGRVIGVGQDATEQGRTTGLQLSAFDVSTPAKPRRISQVTVPNAATSAEGDHHAFTLADGLVLVPFQRETRPQPGTDGSLPEAAPVTMDSGLLAVRLADGGTLGSPTVLRLRADAPIRYDPNAGAPASGYQDVPLRSFVDGGSIWTIAPSGISAHDAETLRRSSFTAFG